MPVNARPVGKRTRASVLRQGEARAPHLPGLWAVVHPSGALIVARSDGHRMRLFDVSAENGAERAIVVDPGARFFSMGGVRADGSMAASLNQTDSWWLRLGLVDLTTGRTTQVPGGRGQ